MDKFFWTQVKRLLRYIPGALLAAAVLLGGLLLVFQTVVDMESKDVDKQKIHLALVGETDDPYLQVGLTVFAGFDSTQFTLELHQMELEEAQVKLTDGEIAAYVVIPENFMDEAMMGNILPLQFVSNAGATSLVSIFKEELTDVIARIVSASQKGVFGLDYAASSHHLPVHDPMNEMSVRYGDLVLARSRVYTLEELGVADELGLEGYMLCGLSVLFLMLCCLPFAPLLIRKDQALPQMLRAKGYSSIAQTLVEYVAFGLLFLIMVVFLLAAAALVAGGTFPFFPALLRVIPVVLMTAAMSYMLCSLSTDLTGGIVLQFFVVLALCFVSGCMYPVFVFPVGVQQAAAWLPAGLARTLLSGCITGQSPGLAPWVLMGYSGIFVAVAALVNARRIKGVGK